MPRGVVESNSDVVKLLGVTAGGKTISEGSQKGRKLKASKNIGGVAQLVRVPDCRSGGCGFESRRPR